MATTLRTGSLDLLCQIILFMKGNENSIEDHQSDVATVFDNEHEDSNSENAWNDDSESEIDI